MRPQPDIVIPSSVDMPRTERSITRNGVPIYTLRSNDFEVVRLTFVFRAGTSMQHKPFTASATANMLGEGSENMSAQQIADNLDFYGSYFDVNIDRDYSYISFCSLKKFFEPTAEVASEIILRPTFPEKELGVYCSKRKQSLSIERKKIDMQSRELFSEALFGKSHPYGISSNEALYDELTRKDIVALYRELYTADNAFIVCSGNIDDKVLNTITHIAEALPKGECREVVFPQAVTTHAMCRDIKTALQSSIRIGPSSGICKFIT